jgi:hypothetical protein
VFENRVLRENFLPKTKDVTGDWRALQTEELCDLYWSPNDIRALKLRSM